MPARSRSRSSKGRRYSKGASKSVESAMRRRKRGTLPQRPQGARWEGHQPEAGDRDWFVGGEKEGGQGSEEVDGEFEKQVG